VERGYNGNEVPPTERYRRAQHVIDFTWDVDPTWFHLGVFPVRYYSVCFILALFGGYALFSWQVRRGAVGTSKKRGTF